MTKPARGGTELMADRINSLPPELLSKFQIIHSRVRELDPNKKKILVLHDLADDPEVQHLRNGGWRKFDKLVFVSHWQQQMYNVKLGIPFSAGVVLQNAITPMWNRGNDGWDWPKWEDPNADPGPAKVKLIYFSTPLRGLELLYPAFESLYKVYGDRIELNVFSSFDLYGWDARDKPFEQLFEQLKAHPAINYSKSVPNEVIRQKLLESHILAYPSIWPETSCLVLIEAMCAGLICVHSSLGALPETAMGHTYMYDYSENVQHHYNRFVETLNEAIEDVLMGDAMPDDRIDFINETYSWDYRKYQWETLLTSML